MRLLAVAQNTFRESIRDKVLYVLLFFAAATILGSKALGWISIGQDVKIVKDISLAAVSVFGALIAIFAGTNLLYKEIDKRTLYTIISRPMHRYEFVLGKYFGLVGLLALVTVIMGGATAAYVTLLGGPVDAVFFQAVLLIFMKLMLVTAFSVLLSALTSPILGAIIVFCLYVFSHATGIFRDLPPQFDGTFAKGVLETLYYVLPNLGNFDIATQAANGVAVPIGYTVWAVLYGVVYTGLVLLLAALAFEGKEV